MHAAALNASFFNHRVRIGAAWARGAALRPAMHRLNEETGTAAMAANPGPSSAHCHQRLSVAPM